MKREIWIISEGTPGHISQSEGLVAALAKRLDLEVKRIEARPKFGGGVRAVFRFWLGCLRLELPKWTGKWLFDGPLPQGKPDCIISSGGKSVFAGRMLSVRHKAPFVFIGERKPYPARLFHTVFTPSKFEREANDVPLEVIPTTANAEALAKAADEWDSKPTGRLWTMVLGGRSASHRFTMQDWKELGEAMNVLAEKNGIRWLVTSSRRTGEEAEKVLQGVLNPEFVADSVWWASKPRRILHAYLGAVEQVFVTQDSVTMVTEATACPFAPVVIAPGEVGFSERSFLPDYFEGLEKNGRIIRKNISELGDFHVLSNDQTRVQDPLEPMVEKFMERLGFE